MSDGDRPGTAAPASPAPRVLVVDDRRANLVAMEAILEPLDCEVVLAGSGEDALRSLFGAPFALVLLDVQMPGMDGFETAALIRGRPRTRHTPIIFVTAVSTAGEHIFAGYEAGAVDYILKPVDPVLLRSKVSVFLELHRANERLRHEAEMRSGQESLALAQRAGMSGIWDWDVAAGRVAWSPELADLLGLDATSGARPDSWLATVDARDRERVLARVDRILEAGEFWDEDFRVVHRTRGIRWIAGRGRVYRDASGSPSRFAGIAVDITDRRRAGERLARLHQTTAALSAAASSDAVVDRIVADAPAATGARSASLWMFDEVSETFVLRGGDGAAVPLAPPAGEGDPLARHAHRMLGDRGAVVVADDGRAVLVRLALGTVLRGVLSLLYARPVEVDEDLRQFLVAFGGGCAQALERARLFDAERRVRERVEALQRATAALSGVADPGTVARQVVRQALDTFGARSAGVILAGDDGWARTAAAGGPPDRDARPSRPVRVDPATPVGRCLVTGTASVETGGEAPAGARGRTRGPLTVVPFLADGAAPGAVALRLPAGRELRAADTDALMAFGRIAGQALARARLFEERERERDRVRFMADLSLALDAADLGTGQRLARLAELVVPALADACLVELVDGAGTRAEALRAADGPVTEPLAALLRACRPGAGTTEAVTSGDFMHVPDVAAGAVAAGLREAGLPDDLAARLADVPVRSLLAVPISARGRRIGAIVLASLASGRRFDPADVAIAAEVGRRSGLSFESVRLYEAQAGMALTLQRSLLPQSLPRTRGLSIAAHYTSAAADTEAGGDWFEAVALTGGRVFLAVGDVVGRGTRAAAAMGQLRSAARAYAHAELGPAATLAHLSGFAAGVPDARASTAVCVEIDAGAGTLRYARAAHPPPLLVSAAGTVRFLPELPGSVLGYGFDRFVEHSVSLEPGSTLLLYTDGAVERRRETIDAGLGRLGDAVADAWPADPRTLCDRIVGRLFPGGPPGDDVALLVARLEPVPAPLVARVPATVAELAGVRRSLREWLAATHLDDAARGDLVLACSEALANAIEHGQRGRTGGTLELRAAWGDDDVLRFVVRDDGRWRPSEEPGGETLRGRGLPIMRAIMDVVDVEPGDDATTVTMEYRPRPSAGGITVGAARPEPAPPPPPPGPPGDGGRTAVVTGELDGAGVASLREDLGSLSDGEGPVTVDLTDVEYIDSAGVSMLWDLAATLRGRGSELVLVAPPGSRARRVLDLCGLAGAVVAGGAGAPSVAPGA